MTACRQTCHTRRSVLHAAGPPPAKWSVTEAGNPFRAPLPILVHLDDELHERAWRQLRAHGGADGLQDRSVATDHHPLLALPLYQDLDLDPRPLPVGDAGGDRVREFVAGRG